MDSHHEKQQLEIRIARLESQNRRFKQGVLTRRNKKLRRNLRLRPQLRGRRIKLKRKALS